MTVYVDLIFLLNFYLDFLILLTTCVTLKRKVKLKRLFLGALSGGVTLITLFWPLNSFILFFFKIVVGIIMNLIAFGYQNLRFLITNFLYFYMISIILGGFVYYLNLEFSYTSFGLLLKRNGLNLNMVIIFLLTPIILIFYVKQTRSFKSNYNLYEPVIIVFKDNFQLKVNGFLDTGNKLFDPVTNKPIIMLEPGLIEMRKYPVMYVPFHSLNGNNLLKCIKPKEVIIKEKRFFNYLIGISDKKFNMNGVECILHSKLLEDIG